MSKSLQEKVNNIVRQRDLCSLMNNTKWSELVSAIIANMPFPPMYDIKYLTYEHNPKNLQPCFSWGDWSSESFPTKEYYINIEWLKIQSRYLKHRGRLIEPELIDESLQLESILVQLDIPYELENGIYCIRGYK